MLQRRREHQRHKRGEGSGHRRDANEQKVAREHGVDQLLGQEPEEQEQPKQHARAHQREPAHPAPPRVRGSRRGWVELQPPECQRLTRCRWLRRDPAPEASSSKRAEGAGQSWGSAAHCSQMDMHEQPRSYSPPVRCGRGDRRSVRCQFSGKRARTAWRRPASWPPHSALP
jgi:hypothetical protein